MKVCRTYKVRSIYSAYSDCTSIYSYRESPRYTKPKRANPATVLLWTFRRMDSRQGLTSRQVISYIKKHYAVSHDPKKTGKSVGKALRCAVEFGLLMKHGNRYYKPQNR